MSCKGLTDTPCAQQQRRKARSCGPSELTSRSCGLKSGEGGGGAGEGSWPLSRRRATSVPCCDTELRSSCARALPVPEADTPCPPMGGCSSGTVVRAARSTGDLLYSSSSICRRVAGSGQHIVSVRQSEAVPH